MLYRELSESYARIESITKRLAMTDELVDLLMKASGEELEIVVRLTKGEVRPGYEGVEIGVAEKLLERALYQVTMLPLDEIERRRLNVGDIGDLSEEIIKVKKQTALFSEPLTLERVFRSLERIATKEGRSSQDIKLKMVAELLHDSTPLEAKYLTRTLCQKLRLGIADMTIIDALTYRFTEGFDELFSKLYDLVKEEKVKDVLSALKTHRTGPIYELEELFAHPSKYGLDKGLAENGMRELNGLRERILRNREKIVRYYNVHPDLGFIARLVSEEGIGLKKQMEVTPGVPLRAMLGERLPSIGEILIKMEGKSAFEYKYDGLRVQAHIFEKEGRKVIRLFSRQLEDITAQFPDVASYLSSNFKGRSCIVEGECVPIEQGTGEMLPFQVISQRRGRKYDVEGKMVEVPVNLVLFDCLYLDGGDLTSVPFLERRGRLVQAFKDIDESVSASKGLSLSVMRVITNEEEGESFFIKALEDGCEGVMAKSVSPNSVYQAGSRGWLWIKYKRDYRSEVSDTLDLVIVGAYYGTGKRSGTYGAFLMASYDPEKDVFETICKLGSGFNDQDLKELPEILEPLKIGSISGWKRVTSLMEPDVAFEPKVVLEVRGAEITFSPNHTCGKDALKKGTGLALRFPRFTGRVRNDKDAVQATNTQEIVAMYNKQRKVISQAEVKS